MSGPTGRAGNEDSWCLHHCSPIFQEYVTGYSGGVYPNLGASMRVLRAHGLTS
jgi:hypothetical protein